MLAVLALVATGAACASPATDLEPNDGEEREPTGSTTRMVDGKVELRVGTPVPVPGTGLTLRLREVADDSRCPVDVTCVWEGNAHALLITVLDGVQRSHTLNSSSADWLEGSTGVDVGPFRITFRSLLPEPKDGVRIAQEDYRLTVLVSEAED